MRRRNEEGERKGREKKRPGGGIDVNSPRSIVEKVKQKTTDEDKERGNHVSKIMEENGVNIEITFLLWLFFLLLLFV